MLTTQINTFYLQRFFFWLCCEHLQLVCCQIDKSVFLICMCFLKLQRVELSRPPYISIIVYFAFSVIQYKVIAISRTNNNFLHSRSHLQSKVHHVLTAEGSRCLWSIIRLSCCFLNKKRALFDYKCSQTCKLNQPCTDPIQVLIISITNLKNSFIVFIAIRSETHFTYHVLQFP